MENDAIRFFTFRCAYNLFIIYKSQFNLRIHVFKFAAFEIYINRIDCLVFSLHQPRRSHGSKFINLNILLEKKTAHKLYGGAPRR